MSRSCTAARVLICANGEPPSDASLARLRAAHDLCIATDGAADWMLRMGQAPDRVLGDMDSASPDALASLPEGAVEPTPDQEACDLEKAVRWCLARGATAITVVGATGRRFDHTITTVSILLALHLEADLRVVSGGSVTRACSSRMTVSGSPGDRLSLTAMAPARGVGLRGVQWPLQAETLLPGSRGVSNVMTEAAAEVTVEQGVVLVTHFAVDGPQI
ncbi:MAG: thiamine diphosphokinase [Armatimonadetes bacterium]|nr:thiamine diphosphokinase [Armatimonadota bacterium]